MAASFVTLLLAYMISQYFRAFLAVVAASLSADLRLDAAALGGLSAAFLFAFAAGQLPVGLALDRFGPRRTLAVAMVPAVLGAVWLGVAATGREATVAFALIGIGCAANLMAPFYFIGRTYPVDRFVLLTSLLVGIGSMGDPLSGAPLAWLVGRLGWRVAMFGSAVFTAAVIGLVLLTVTDPPRLTGSAARQSVWASLSEALRLRALWPILPITAIGYAVVICVRSLWISAYLEQVQHLGPAELSLAATGMGFVMACGSLAYPTIARLCGGIQRGVLAGSVLVAALCFGLAALPSGSAVVATGLLLAIGGFGLTYSMIMAHGRSFMPAHILGAGVTVMNLGFMGGAGLLQWSSGHLVRASELAGTDPGATFSRLFAAFGVLMLASAAIYGLATPERRSEPGRTTEPA